MKFFKMCKIDLKVHLAWPVPSRQSLRVTKSFMDIVESSIYQSKPRRERSLGKPCPWRQSPSVARMASRGCLNAPKTLLGLPETFSGHPWRSWKSKGPSEVLCWKISRTGHLQEDLERGSRTSWSVTRSTWDYQDSPSLGKLLFANLPYSNRWVV